MKSDELEREKFQVINETPVAGKIPNGISQRYYNSDNPRSQHIESIAKTDGASFESNDNSPLRNMNPIKSRSAAEVFRKIEDEAVESNFKHLFELSTREEASSGDPMVDHNTKTPDLDKVKKYLRHDRTPDNDLLSRLKRTPDDTPASQRQAAELQSMNLPKEPHCSPPTTAQLFTSTVSKPAVNDTLSGDNDIVPHHDIGDNYRRHFNQGTKRNYPAEQGADLSMETESHGIKLEFESTSKDNLIRRGQPRVLEKRYPCRDTKLDISQNKQEVPLARSSQFRSTDYCDNVQRSVMQTLELEPVVDGTEECSDIVIPATNSSGGHPKEHTHLEGQNSNTQYEPVKISKKTEKRCDKQKEVQRSREAISEEKTNGCSSSEVSYSVKHESNHTQSENTLNATTQADSKLGDLSMRKEKKGDDTQILSLKNDISILHGLSGLPQDTQADISPSVAALVPQHPFADSGLCSSPIFVHQSRAHKLNTQPSVTNVNTQVIESPENRAKITKFEKAFLDQNDSQDYYNLNLNEKSAKEENLVKTNPGGTDIPSRSVDLIAIEEESSDNENDSEKRVLLRFSNKNDLQHDSLIEKQKETNKETLIYSDIEDTQELPEIEDIIPVKGKNVSGTQSSSTPCETIENEVLSNSKELSPSSSCFTEESQEVVKNRRKSRKRKRSEEDITCISQKSNQKSEMNSPKKRLVRAADAEQTVKIQNTRLNQMNISQVAPPGGSSENGDAVDFRSSTPVKPTSIEVGTALFSNTVTHITQRKASEGDNLYPKEIRTIDNDLLSKKDVIFPTAVWCHYSLNFVYYPGILLTQDQETNTSEVLFETGSSLVKNEDMFYLDLRIGDTVNWNSKSYTVVALECLSHNNNVIRCIRGFDTVHLKKRNNTGKLGKRTLIKPLSSITLTLSEWARRPKIMLFGSSDFRSSVFEDLSNPIRGRKNTTMITPVSPKKYIGLSETDNHSTPFGSGSSDPHSMSKERNFHQGRGASPLFSGNIFDGCLFVLTGLSEACRQEVSNMIASQNGTVAAGSFSTLLAFTTKGSLHWIDVRYSSYRFVCLITEKHSRSLKYLETLALGWPTLHWKFVSHCIRRNQLDVGAVLGFLLPAGESHRLSINPAAKTGVVLSSNIFQFYSKLLAGKPLGVQLDNKPMHLDEFHVLIYGKSEFNNFIHFIFRVFGACSISYLDRFRNIHKWAIKLENNPGGDSEFKEFVGEIQRRSLTLAPQKKILVYINERTCKNSIAESIKDKLLQVFTTQSDLKGKLYVESKEWLIQSIINTDAGLT